jgi:hypothetical protein
MRGLIISPEYVADKGSFQLKSSQINPINLRQYLLYWDRLDFPDNNIISIGGSPEIEYLQEVGILQRSRVTAAGRWEVGEAFLWCQMEAFKENNHKEPGSWSLAQPNNKLVLDKASSVQTRNLEVELYQSLPIPSEEVSLEDILLFKENRKDELLEFRFLMDNIYSEIIESGDPDRTKLKSIEQLQRKIVELNMVMNEGKMKSLLGNLKIEVDVSKMVEKTAIGIGLGTIFNFPVGLSGVIGLASSFIQVKSELSLKPKEIPEGLRDYAYLYYAHKSLA